ncbi:aspartyl protease family protein 1-like [Silene latifolia]|uniref:aspartyl protease family protein 1-like n=1 Tax=Silene latifolia TaxID=37657 RepID=UPI003D77EE90
MASTSYGYVVLLLIICVWRWQSCEGVNGVGFDIHHRFSDPVKSMFGVTNEFPEKGTMEYYDAMVHRDRFHGRRLAGQTDHKTPLTFSAGNATLSIPELGFLYYANVSIGTPASWYLVALDTGSGLFWLPCDCSSNCVRSYEFSPTETIEFNIYSLSTSSTGTRLSCSSPLCERSCLPSESYCPYRVEYLSANTSSSGYVVQDLLHLTTDNANSQAIDVKIPFGCGVIQTGHFLEAGAPNGLFGLSMDVVSLPSVLASQELVANSFSMCFSPDGIGRISFGDKGSQNQSQTPVLQNRLMVYTVKLTNVSVGLDSFAANLNVIFDTGTSFTLLADPVYSLLTEKFNSQVKNRRVGVHPDSAFQFCYLMTSKPDDLVVPAIRLTMRGGDKLSVVQPWIMIVEDDTRFYCLAVIKSDHDISIIGENFMTGYRVVFDNEKPAVGWTPSDCGESVPFSPNLSPRRSSATSFLHRGYLAFAIILVQFFSVQLMVL